jgi:drug/metabolite transporter (DMT)-like permease
MLDAETTHPTLDVEPSSLLPSLSAHSSHTPPRRRRRCTRELALVLVALTSVQFIFSGWHVLGKLSLSKPNNVQPLVFALYREVSASLCMLAIALCRDGFLRPARRDVPRFLLLGACSFANVVGSVVALKFISATNYALLQPAVPVFAAAAAVALRLEPPNILKLLGVLLSVAGAIVVTVLSPDPASPAPNGTSPNRTGGGAWGSSSSSSSSSSSFSSSSFSSSFSSSTPPSSSSQLVLGNVITIVAAMGMALLVVLQKRVLQMYPYATVTLWFYSCGALLTVLALGVQAVYTTGPLGALAAVDFAPTHAVVWGALVYAAGLATVYNYLVMTWANTKVPATMVSLFLTLQPVGTVVLSLVFLNSAPTWNEGVGGGLVIAGLVWVCVVEARTKGAGGGGGEGGKGDMGGVGGVRRAEGGKGGGMEDRGQEPLLAESVG